MLKVVFHEKLINCQYSLSVSSCNILCHHFTQFFKFCALHGVPNDVENLIAVFDLLGVKHWLNFYIFLWKLVRRDHFLKHLVNADSRRALSPQRLLAELDIQLLADPFNNDLLLTLRLWTKIKLLVLKGPSAMLIWAFHFAIPWLFWTAAVPHIVFIF